MCLNDIQNDKYYIVNKINLDSKNKRRLYDIGLINNTKIKLLFASPSKLIKAYLIRNSIIAIRDRDANLIEVSELND